MGWVWLIWIVMCLAGIVRTNMRISRGERYE